MFTIDVYKDEKAPAFALLGVTLKKYGMEALEYPPELLRPEIDKDYNIHIADIQMDKLQAAMIVLYTDAFYDDWRVFETCCHLFNSTPTDHDIVNPLEAEDIATGIAEAALIKSSILKDGEELHYHDEVRAYAGQIFHEYGMSKAPKIFPTAIMPKNSGNSVNDDNKNEALNELFDAHSGYIISYIDKLT